MKPTSAQILVLYDEAMKVVIAQKLKGNELYRVDYIPRDECLVGIFAVWGTGPDDVLASLEDMLTVEDKIISIEKWEEPWLQVES
jgi:hypothetical protein